MITQKTHEAPQNHWAANRTVNFRGLEVEVLHELLGGPKTGRYLYPQRTMPCYAVSYSRHAAKWYPWFVRMYFVTKRALAGDLVAVIRYVQE